MRFLWTPNTPAAKNMAVDQYFFNLADKDPGFEPVIRLYTWKNPTLSLGFHQRAGLFDFSRVASSGLDWVRRPTGGRAVLHDRELTYSVIGRLARMPFEKSLAGIYNQIALGLQAGLAAAGLKAEIARGKKIEGVSRAGPDLPCFASTSKYELVINEKKLVGSAQKKSRKAFLQHGAILLDRGPFGVTDFMTLSVEDQDALAEGEQRHRIFLKEAGWSGVKSGGDLAGGQSENPAEDLAADLMPFLRAGFEKIFGDPLEEKGLQEKELAKIDELVKTQFSNETWNSRV